MALIADIHASSSLTYGAPRIHAELGKTHGIRVGRKRVARLMKELQIEGVSRRKKGRAKKGEAEMHAFPDLVKRGFSASRPDELFLADITYIPTFKGWLYLALIVDVCTRRCCGCQVSNDLSSNLVIGGLAMAVTLERAPSGHRPPFRPGKPVRVPGLRKGAALIWDRPLHGKQG